MSAVLFQTWRGHRAGWKQARTKRRSHPSARKSRIEPLEQRLALASEVVISELLASSVSGLLDYNGNASDWFEIHNRDTTSVDLNGWHVTDRSDNLTKWQIPVSTVLAPDARVVVFASNQDFAAPNGELHANFALSKGGEYLGLADPLGVLVHSYSPEFPPQTTDVSYGLNESSAIIDDFAFFATPTPGTANSAAFGGLQPPVFSVTSKTFPEEVMVELKADDPQAVIRFTTDGSVPDESSAQYIGPLSITSSTQIRARLFRDGFVPSNTVSETYLKLSTDMQAVSSDLPIVVIENFKGVTPFDKNFRNAFMSVFEPGPSGRSDVNGAAALHTRIGMHRRGGSTFTNPKLNLRIETRDEFDQDAAVEILGFPSESDFVLYAPYTYDRAMIRNTFIFELSNQMGRYASRTRFVELYVNFNNDELEERDYLGVYVLEENIKADENRVDIPRLSPNHNSEPDLTGGYIFKVDRSGSTEAEFKTLRYSYVITEPAADDITTEQQTYLTDYVVDLETALYGNDFTDPSLGYKAFLNVGPTIDHHLLRFLTNIVDHFQLSTHFVKHRNGKVEYGPIWDHDRSMGSDGGGDSLDATGFGVFLSSHWFNRLFQDPDFAHAWADRWAELRKTFFAVENIHAIIDGQAAEIAEAQVRNFQRWPVVAPDGGGHAEPGLTGWEGEVSHVKQWLRQRVEWIDSQLIEPPSFHLHSSLPSGYALTLTAPAESIYVTLDGTDPLASGGQPSPQAILYDGQPLMVDGITSITTRARATNSKLPWSWSAIASAQYIPGTPQQPAQAVSLARAQTVEQQWAGKEMQAKPQSVPHPLEVAGVEGRLLSLPAPISPKSLDAVYNSEPDDFSALPTRQAVSLDAVDSVYREPFVARVFSVFGKRSKATTGQQLVDQIDDSFVSEYKMHSL